MRTLTQSSLRRSIGIVQQDVFLFADTIRENIRYGRPGASDEEVERAARQAEIYDDIMAMPDGFDTTAICSSSYMICRDAPHFLYI